METFKDVLDLGSPEIMQKLIDRLNAHNIDHDDFISTLEKLVEKWRNTHEVERSPVSA